VVIVAALTLGIIWNNNQQASATALRTADTLFHEIATKVDERMTGMLGAVKARMAGRYLSTPATKRAGVSASLSLPCGSRVAGWPSAFWKDMWMWTPLPTPSGVRRGVKLTRSSRRQAVARASWRTTTAWSAAASASAGLTVISY